MSTQFSERINADHHSADAALQATSLATLRVDDLVSRNPVMIFSVRMCKSQIVLSTRPEADTEVATGYLVDLN